MHQNGMLFDIGRIQWGVEMVEEGVGKAEFVDIAATCGYGDELGGYIQFVVDAVGTGDEFFGFTVGDIIKGFESYLGDVQFLYEPDILLLGKFLGLIRDNPVYGDLCSRIEWVLERVDAGGIQVFSDIRSRVQVKAEVGDEDPREIPYASSLSSMEGKVWLEDRGFVDYKDFWGYNEIRVYQEVSLDRSSSIWIARYGFHTYRSRGASPEDAIRGLRDYILRKSIREIARIDESLGDSVKDRKDVVTST